MLPFIREGRDLLVIERPAEWDTIPDGSVTAKLKKYDVPLYKRDGGSAYVLHRVVAIDDKGYVLCGDNRHSREHGINDRHVYGLLTGIIRDGKEVGLNGLGYRCYVHLWCDLFPLRAGIIYIRDRFGRRKKA